MAYCILAVVKALNLIFKTSLVVALFYATNLFASQSCGAFFVKQSFQSYEVSQYEFESQLQDKLDKEIWVYVLDYLKKNNVLYKFIKTNPQSSWIQILPEGESNLNRVAMWVQSKKGTEFFLVPNNESASFSYLMDKTAGGSVEVKDLRVRIPILYMLRSTRSSLVRNVVFLHEAGHLLRQLLTFEGVDSIFTGYLSVADSAKSKIPIRSGLPPQKSWFKKIVDRFFKREVLEKDAYSYHLEEDELFAYMRQLYQMVLIDAKKLKMGKLSNREKQYSFQQISGYMEVLERVSDKILYNFEGLLAALKKGPSASHSVLVPHSLQGLQVLYLRIIYTFEGVNIIYSTPLISKKELDSAEIINQTFTQQLKASWRAATRVYYRITRLRVDTAQAPRNDLELQEFYNKVREATKPSFLRSLKESKVD